MAAKYFRPLSRNERNVLLFLARNSARFRLDSDAQKATRLGRGAVHAALVALERRALALVRWGNRVRGCSTLTGEQLAVEILAARRDP